MVGPEVETTEFTLELFSKVCNGRNPQQSSSGTAIICFYRVEKGVSFYGNYLVENSKRSSVFICPEVYFIVRIISSGCQIDITCLLSLQNFINPLSQLIFFILTRKSCIVASIIVLNYSCNDAVPLCYVRRSAIFSQHPEMLVS